jgi:hypothetical protein
MDICGAGLLNNRVEWYSNDAVSLDSWGRHIVKSGFALAHKVQATDINYDGRPDILGTAYNGGIGWWKNTDGNNITWEEDFVSGFSTAVIAWAFDYDEDGDMDIFGSSQGQGKVAMWENTDGNFNWQYSLLDNLAGAWPIYFGDMDGDTDIDLVCGGRDANKICWYENELTFLNVNDPVKKPESIEVTCWPVPFRDKLNIGFNTEVAGPVLIDIFDSTGAYVSSMIRSLSGDLTITINWNTAGLAGKTIPGGSYLVKISGRDFSKTKKVVRCKSSG